MSVAAAGVATPADRLPLARTALLAALVVGCPGVDATGVLRKCTRARAFYSIYMTLGGVLALLLASAPLRLARLGRDAAWLRPAWLLGASALALTYVRGAWLGFAAGALVAVAVWGGAGSWQLWRSSCWWRACPAFGSGCARSAPWPTRARGTASRCWTPASGS